MKYTLRIWGLTFLLLFLWLFNSYQQGDFQTQPITQKESMEVLMPTVFPPLPQTEYSDKKQQLEIDLEKYEKTVNAVNDTIRERIQTQQSLINDAQVQLRPTYDTPRFDEDSNHTSSSNANANAKINREPTNPPPVPKKPNVPG
jgi:hypothetical protein